MSCHLVVTPAANRDIDEAINWYDSQEGGLGNRFIAAVQDRFMEISKFPLSSRLIPNTAARKSLLSHWPYFIYYRIVNEVIRVFAVIHTSRDPNYILSRVDHSPAH